MPLHSKSRPKKGDAGKSCTDINPTLVLSTLIKEYGAPYWQPRMEAVDELIFTVLTQHTSDSNAQIAYEQMRKSYPTWESVISADTPHLADVIRSGGLANQKAPRIQTILRAILAKRGELNIDFLRSENLPTAKSWLQELPGVGPKTAAVVLAFAFGMPAMPVDTHVYRVAKRLGLIDETVTVAKAHDLLEQLIEPRDVYSLHVLLITHGRTMCKALRPRCNVCPLREPCPAQPIVAQSHLGKSVERRTDTRSPY